MRFFCQLCQKQCRDENGFKCHTMSEGHQRQMMLCADDPSHMLKVTSEFSADFLGGFLRILRLCYNGKRVKANTVYQDYISDRNHTHMNATRWHTLSGFVQWLGKTGYCKVRGRHFLVQGKVAFLIADQPLTSLCFLICIGPRLLLLLFRNQ